MNDSDPIVDEVRRIRDAHAAKFNYDLRAIFQDIKEQERRSGREFVSFADAERDIAPSQAAQPSVPALASRDSLQAPQTARATS